MRWQARTRRWAFTLAALLGSMLIGSWAWAAQSQLRGAQARSGSDPWPSSPVLTRLFRLPGKADATQLQSDLGLSREQVQRLRALATEEQKIAQAGEKVATRLEAQRLNADIAEMRQNKDKQARAILGDKYLTFREWVRQWWKAKVVRSQADTARRASAAPVAGEQP